MARERFVWSPENGGCLMLQRFIDGAWQNWTSQEEGRHPELNTETRRAVARLNRWHRAATLKRRAKRLEERAQVLRCRAQLLTRAS